MVEKFWNSDSIGTAEGESLSEKLEYLKQEKEKKIQEYDLAIQVVKDAINGYSIETIARQKGISIEEVKRILE